VFQWERSEMERERLDSENPEVSILIPCYNGFDCIGNCLKSIMATAGPSYEVIVIDNHSKDQSLGVVRSHSNVRIIPNATNLGFARAINQGAEIAKGKFLAILNQDAEVDPNWLLQLTTVLKTDPTVAICGPKILEASDRTRIQQLGVRVDRFGFGMYICDDGEAPQDVFMVSGAAAIVASPLSGWLSDRAGKRNVIIWANIALAFLFVAVARAELGLWLVAGIAMLSMAASARQAPLHALTTEIVLPEIRGEYIAVRNASSQLGIAAIATISASAFDAAGFSAVALIAAFATLLIPVCCIWLKEPRS